MCLGNLIEGKPLRLVVRSPTLVSLGSGRPPTTTLLDAQITVPLG
jgi:hypothetical protein